MTWGKICVWERKQFKIKRNKSDLNKSTMKIFWGQWENLSIDWVLYDIKAYF